MEPIRGFGYLSRMRTLQRSVRLSIVLAAAVIASVAVSTAASPAAGTKKVWWIDAAVHAEQHPDFVYFTANAGGQVRHIKWKHWGENRTVGRGRYVDTSAHYPGKLNQNGPAKLIARKPIRCTPAFGAAKGKKLRVYRHVRLIYPNGKGGRTSADVSGTAGYGTCKETGNG